MTSSNRKKIFIGILLLGFAAVFVLTCRSFNFSVADYFHCCGTSAEWAHALERTVELHLPMPSGILTVKIFLLAAFLLGTLVAARLPLRTARKICDYAHAIRDRYGSYSCLNYLVLLFRRGLLHPKVF